MDSIYKLKVSPVANEKSVVQGDKFRFTILTDKMIRMEYNENNTFEDRATQTVINRQFPVVDFRVNESEDTLEIITNSIHITYNKKKFTKNGLSVRMTQNPFSHHATWYFGDKCESNLMGTARTLDGVDGPCELEEGILSRHGYSVIDDSKSLAIIEDGWVEPITEEKIDMYFLGYGRDYLKCLEDFYKLCGKTPMLPRYALGNWWSRYYQYTQESYMELMDRFEDEGIPISVAVFDMDWHYVKLDKKYGHGWTGYTWDKNLFPDHKKMLQELKSRGIHTTLNVHPADGVRGHEDAYLEMAKELGVDYENEVPVQFDITDKRFLKAYFEKVHHPLEDDGVDFWWLDWQQGNTSKVAGLDPLWMLNHFHYLDNQRGGKRPMTFSRYAGVGSHRYPIGFSGDTVTTWESLDFQPYFTATASNVGYGWWSHDIGGHQFGYKDDEMAVRWTQYGVFSPIMRLHSNNNEFGGKEPWNFGLEASLVMKKFMRLRSQMIPYLYTMNRRFSVENQPLVQPMYYQYPLDKKAYETSNQYYFGSQLIVNPITKKMSSEAKLGYSRTWLPEGTWYDFFTGLSYRGNRFINMYRTLEEMPVVAKSGAIIPLESEKTISSNTQNPKNLNICVFAGDNGEFELYEDDGLTMNFENGEYVTTKYQLNWNNDKNFVINPAEGNLALIPQTRNYTLSIYGIAKEDVQTVSINNEVANYQVKVDKIKNIVSIIIDDVKNTDTLTVSFNENTELAKNNVVDRARKILNDAQITYVNKDKIYSTLLNNDSLETIVSEILTLDVCTEIKESISELVLARP